MLISWGAEEVDFTPAGKRKILQIRGGIVIRQHCASSFANLFYSFCVFSPGVISDVEEAEAPRRRHQRQLLACGHVDIQYAAGRSVCACVHV